MPLNRRLGQRLKLRDLRILLAAADARSMAQAARNLSVSQPAVSKAIADLERTLGVRLLDRSRQGLELTMYGRALIRHSRAAFDELQQGLAELEFLADPSAGELRIGAAEAMAAGFLPAVLDRMSQQHPRLVLHVVQAVFTTAQHRELRDRSIDLLLGRLFEPLDDELRADALFDDPVIVVGAQKGPWERARRLADLANAPWILPPAESVAGQLAAEIFRLAGAEAPHAPVATLSMHLCLKLAATGRFVALMPASVLRFASQELPLKALPIRLPDQARPVGIVTLKNRTLSPVAQIFIDCAREVARPLAQRKRAYADAPRATPGPRSASRTPRRPGSRSTG